MVSVLLIGLLPAEHLDKACLLQHRHHPASTRSLEGAISHTPVLKVLPRSVSLIAAAQQAQRPARRDPNREHAP
jgi:hypothetical protein